MIELRLSVGTAALCSMFMVALAGCTGPVVHGVKPISPPLGSRLDPPVVESLQPTFRWNHVRGAGFDLIVALPIPWNQRLPYDVEGTRSDDKDDVITIVYYCEDLDEAEHTIEVALEPDTVYIWSVRTRTGVPTRVSGWSSFDARMPLTADEQAQNLTMATGYVAAGVGLAIATMGHSPTLEPPPYKTGETRVLEYHPFTFRTPPRDDGD
jgi:hypothetical protein